jgi:peptidoglycan hydrolase-like protein with peptidoglycan-binding domain
LSIHARLAHGGDAAAAERAGARVGKRLLAGGLVLLALLVAGAAAVAFVCSSVDVVAGDEALAQVELGMFAGTLVSATAHGPHGGSVPIAVHDGQVTPLRHVMPGTTLTVAVRVRRPGWSGWALGHEVERKVTVRTPSAGVQTRWTTLRAGAPLGVAFDAPVTRLAYGAPGHLRHVVLRRPQRVVSLGRQAAAGTLAVAGAPRAWEQLPHPHAVTWFPAGASPVAVASPAPGARLGPLSPLRLTFSKPLTALGSARPAFAAAVAGRWRRADSHTLVFTPSGTGFGLGASVRLTLPAGVALAGTGAAGSAAGADAAWTVPPGSTLRLHELLAQLGYLPLDWHAAGAPIASDDGAQLSAAADPPRGRFAWRWSLPSQLTAQWRPDAPSALTRGALMAFQSDHGLATDGIAGPAVWSALFAALRAHQVNKHGYSYVLVHRDSGTQTATLIHDGRTILTTPANTGVPAAPTQLGTFPVYLRYDVTTMSGTNPDGTRYRDPGIRWVSYFNGGDALHAFDRASFGTPQSVGCVELPEAAAAKIYPYTPIGTLVQIAA